MAVAHHCGFGIGASRTTRCQGHVDGRADDTVLQMKGRWGPAVRSPTTPQSDCGGLRPLLVHKNAAGRAPIFPFATTRVVRRTKVVRPLTADATARNQRQARH